MRKSEPTIPAEQAPAAKSLPLRVALHANAGPVGGLFIVALLGRFVVTRSLVGAYNLDVTMMVGVAVIMAVSLQLINGVSGQFSLGHAGFMAVGAYLSGYASLTFSREMTDPAAVMLFFVALGSCLAIGGFALLLLFLLARWSGRVHSTLPAILMVSIFAWAIVDVAIASKMPGPPPGHLVFSRVIYLLRSLFESTIGAGTAPAANASALLPAAARPAICFLVLLMGGGACAATAGLIVGLPTLRLRGDYLAIATLGFAEIIRVAITNAQPLGGALGLGGIPAYTDFPWLYGTLLVTVVVIWRLAYSAKGRAIQAVREDEIAAAAIGIDTTYHKVLAFVIGAFFGGVGGVLYAHYTGFITPNDFGFVRSVEFVVMVTLGGLGSITGAILAAVVLTVLPEVLRGIADWRMVIYSLLLIFMMLLRPQGLLGGRELWPTRRGTRRAAVATEDRDDRQPNPI